MRFTKNLLYTLILLPLLSFTEPPTQDGYHYSVDLVNVENDKVRVTLNAPSVDKNSVVFNMPKIIPGTYTIYDFGRFVSDFKAFDANGSELTVKQQNVNSWKIKGAKSLHTISYLVEDSYDSTNGKSVFGMAGTNIEAGKNFLLNGHGFFGYFEGMEYVPVKLEVHKPEGFYGSSAYLDQQLGQQTDYFVAPDYHYLLDMPIMYCLPDTATINLGGMEVLISVYSPNGKVQASYLMEQFTPLFYSQMEYFEGELPVDRYAFIMYFMGEQLPIGTGALEHNYSSVYCIPEYEQEFLAPFLVDIASHEFFHIITPLNVHSEEIHYFDFNDPDMSMHLWMYEGITEYFSHHNQVRSGMIDYEEYLERMGEKIKNSQTNYQDDLAFTKLSKYCLGKHENQYGNVYQKGALIGMCLDIELLDASNGEYGLIELMGDLSDKFGSKEPFKDKKLFKEIEELSYPQVGKFLKDYVDSNRPIPYEEFFGKAGIRYQGPSDTYVYSFGDVGIGFNQETGRVFVNSTNNLNEFGKALGYQQGDQLVSIQGKEIPSQGIREFFDAIKADMQEGEIFQVVVDRNGQQATLSAPIQKARRIGDPVIELLENPTSEQLSLQRAWLGEKKRSLIKD